jgi:hypothetical protein
MVHSDLTIGDGRLKEKKIDWAAFKEFAFENHLSSPHTG